MVVSRKQSTPNFPKNKHFFPLDTHTCVCVSGGKKCSFFGKFGRLCLLETPVLRFALLPYYRRNVFHMMRVLVVMMVAQRILTFHNQPVITCSKLTIETLEKGVKYVRN